MEQIENIIILGMILFIAYLYFSKNKEHFVVKYLPFYPITTNINPKYNNYTNSVDDNRLDILKKSLENIRIESNNGNVEYKEFNKVNLPIIKKSLEFSNIKPVTEFLLNKINEDLGEAYDLILDDVRDINKIETDNEAKINFRLICQFKIKTNDTIKVIKPEYTKDSGENRLIILVEILSQKILEDNEKIYINYMQISGLTGGDFLPGSNYYDNNDFLLNDFNLDEVLEKKKNLNSDEVNNLNENIEDNTNLNDITIDESFEESMINTEEAESFFNM